MNSENEKLFEKYLRKHGSDAINVIRKDYRNKFKNEPPFWDGDLCDAVSKYSTKEVIDIYLSALKKGKPYKLKDGDIIESNIKYINN